MRTFLVRHLAVVALALFALAGRPAGQATTAEPATNEHCACSGTICPIGANGRGCSCGCMLTASQQPVQALAAASGSECRGGSAGGYPCSEVDLLAFLPLAEIGGGRANDIWGWTDPETGRELAIIGRNTGTSIVDVTVPTRPVYIGDLPTQTVASTWRDIKVHADHAFIVSEAANHGLQVFDLREAVRVDAPPVTFEPTAHYAGFGSAHNLAINTATGFAYAVGTRTCAGGLHVVNVQDPRRPAVAGCFALDGYTHDAQCVVYDGPDGEHRDREICFNANEDTLTIVDVSDKQMARQLSRTGYDASAYTHQGWLTGDRRFFLVDDEGDERAFGRPTRTFVWDVSDLDAPFIAAIYEGQGPAVDHNLYVRGDLAYEANYRSGLRVLELGDLASGAMREAGFFDVYPADDGPEYNGAWSVYPFFTSGTVVVSGIEQGLFVLRPRRAPQEPSRGLTLTLAATGQPAMAGHDLVYVGAITNHGRERITRIQATLQLPGSAAPGAVAINRGACRVTGVITCDVDALSPGSMAVFTAVVRPQGAGMLVASAKVVSDPASGDPSDDAVVVSTRVEEARREMVLRLPVGGETLVQGRNATIQWALRGVGGGVRIELSRNDGRTWTPIAADAPNTGFYDWLVSGGATFQGRVRVTSLENPQMTAASPAAFTIR